MNDKTESSQLLSTTDMEIVERVLEMGTGYVLDFSNRSFDDFIAQEVGIDATAPRYSENGTSKANRLRTILHSLSAGQISRLLQAMLQYRDSPARSMQVSLLDEEWREAYARIIKRLKEQVEGADKTYASSAWTGRRTMGEQVSIVRGLAPVALRELDTLATLIESKRFNDPITAQAVECLRDLHREIGDLIDAIDRGNMTREAVKQIEEKREQLAHYIKEGAKLSVVAPSMTFGVMHILAWITGVPIDSTLVSAVFGTIVGADALKSFAKRSSLAKP